MQMELFKKVAKERDKNQIEMVDLYFSLHVPKKPTLFKEESPWSSTPIDGCLHGLCTIKRSGK